MKKNIIVLVLISLILLLASISSLAQTPVYNDTVMKSYRKLQFKISMYENLPEKGKGIRLGVYQAQAACGPGASKINMARLEKAVAQARKYKVQLLSFPELFIPGYTQSPESAKKVAEFKDGAIITRAREIARKNNMALLVPYAEKVESPGNVLKYYDSIAVINENGKLLDSYKKTQLYGQQERDNFSFGKSNFPVHRIFGFPVGILNCYECEFPELARVLALKGAKLIVGPTAADRYYTLPDGKRSSVPYPDISRILLPAMAYENNIFFAYSNRAGYEERDGNKWHYRGNSIVIGPHADVIVAANNEQDTMLIADCIPEYYGRTHPAPKYYYLKDRRPDLYRELIKKKVYFKKDGYTYPDYIDGREMKR